MLIHTAWAFKLMGRTKKHTRSVIADAVQDSIQLQDAQKDHLPSTKLMAAVKIARRIIDEDEKQWTETVAEAERLTLEARADAARDGKPPPPPVDPESLWTRRKIVVYCHWSNMHDVVLRVSSEHITSAAILTRTPTVFPIVWRQRHGHQRLLFCCRTREARRRLWEPRATSLRRVDQRLGRNYLRHCLHRHEPRQGE